MFEPRTYREKMGKERFKSFTIIHHETDLWIGIDPDSYSENIQPFALQKSIELRKTLDNFINSSPKFATSFEPVNIQINSPTIVKQMAEASSLADIGPMGAVAGAFSETIGKAIEKEFGVKEIAVENGGDIYLNIQKPFISSIYAGNSPLSEKVGILIPETYSPLGVCTSSGTIGHSHSSGIADAVMVACKNTMLADAYATALCNKIKNIDDISNTLEIVTSKKEILSCVIICKDKIGIKGEFELKILK